MTARDLGHRLEYGAYQAVAGLTQRLPLVALRAWGRVVGGFAYLALGRRRRLTLDNLARALPELDEAARRRVARECFAVQSATYHEQIWAMRRGSEIAERFEFVGREHFEAAHARGKGVFVLTGHYGCWELAGYPLGRWLAHGGSGRGGLGKLYIVARPQNNPYIAAHFEALRESNGNEQIDRSRAGTRMLRVLKKGGAIGVAIDQRVRPQHGLLVPFFGRFAWTSRLPAYLSTITGCAAVPMVCEPLADGRYRMTFDAAILPEGEGDDEIERLTRRYAAALEPHIRAKPELWLWLHSRWQRTRKQRRPEAIEKLVSEARLPAAPPLVEVARRSPAGSATRRLAALVTDDFLESGAHLLLAGNAAGAAAPAIASARDAATGTRVSAAASFGEAAARLGHATRYFTLGDLLDRLSRARAENRLTAELRALDPIPLVVVDGADPRLLDRCGLELLSSFLGHRLDRGSVVLAGVDVAAWRANAASIADLAAFLDACEAIELSPLESDTFGAAGAQSDAADGDAADAADSADAEAGAVRA